MWSFLPLVENKFDGCRSFCFRLKGENSTIFIIYYLIHSVSPLTSPFHSR